IALRMVANFFKNRGKIALRSPVKLGCNLSIIHYQPWNIERARGEVRFDRMFSETLGAPACELGQRHRITLAASNVERRDLRFLRVLDLSCDQFSQVVGMKPVPNLSARPIETNVF